MKKFTLFFLFFIFLSGAFCQPVKKKKVPEWNGNIKSQFEEVFNKSGKYQDYKVIKSYWFTKLKKNTLDTLALREKEIKNLKAEIQRLNKKINELEYDIVQDKGTIDKLNNKVDNINLFGIGLSKKTYNLILWGIISILLILLLFFIFKFRNSNAITKETLANYKDLSDEYESYRTQSLERVQALQRKLLDATNNQSANS